MRINSVSIILIILMSISSLSYAQNQPGVVECLEYNFFKTTFKQEKITKRLNRVEKNVYGDTYDNLPVQERISRLNNFWHKCQYYRPAPAYNNQTTQSAGRNNYNRNNYYQYKPGNQRYNYQNQNSYQPVAPDNRQAQSTEFSEDIGYPMIDEVESRLLGKAFQNEDIYKRLERLELNLYGAVSSASLSDRVDKIRTSVLGSQSVGMNTENNYNPPGPEYGFSNFENTSPQQMLDVLESRFFGRAFTSEPEDRRLSRIENHLFGQSSGNYSNEDRLARIMAVAEAQNSDPLYEDTAQLRKYSNIQQGVTLVAFLVMILQGLLF